MFKSLFDLFLKLVIYTSEKLKKGLKLHITHKGDNLVGYHEVLQKFDVKISGAPDFTYKEFIKSPTAQRLGIDNCTSPYELKNIQSLAKNVLQPLREKFGGIRITSGYRNLQLNTAIGGSPSSNHCKGEAADIEPLQEDVTLLDLLNYINDNLPFRELIAEYFPDGWVHVAYRENNNSGVVKLKDDSHNYDIVTVDDINKLYK